MTIKTQILKTMHKKSNYKKKILLENRSKIFLIRNYVKRQKLFKNLRFMSTKCSFEKEKKLIFHLNQRFVIENLRRYNLYVILRKKNTI